jgi:Protein of unknown function (DUF2786)
MGKNNRARRAAKASARSRADHHTSTSGVTRQQRKLPPTADEQVAELLRVAPQARAAGDAELVEWAAVQLCGQPVDLVRFMVARELRSVVAAAWSGGWQPAELVRQARRTVSVAAVDLVRSAVAADHADRPEETLDPQWREQLGALGLPRVDDADGGGWVAAWAGEAALGVFSEMETVIEVLHAMRWIPVIEELIPPPGGPTRRGSARAAPISAAGAGERAMLDKIRAMLAKAESTPFEAEAEAFTAKAQELMTRHAIEDVMLAGHRAAGDEPIAIRIGIDDPYVNAKSVLLHVVAEAGRCRAVFFGQIAAMSVVGFRADVSGVEMLYTSLLVQAQTALTTAAKSLPAGARQRTRSFRSSFLLAYAYRIGERLAAVNAEVIADAESAGRVVHPALLSREVAVEAAVGQRYGSLRSTRVRGGHDAFGWVSGREAADNAKIVAGALPGG